MNPALPFKDIYVGVGTSRSTEIFDGAGAWGEIWSEAARVVLTKRKRLKSARLWDRDPSMGTVTIFHASDVGATVCIPFVFEWDAIVEWSPRTPSWCDTMEYLVPEGVVGLQSCPELQPLMRHERLFIFEPVLPQGYTIRPRDSVNVFHQAQDLDPINFEALDNAKATCVWHFAVITEDNEGLAGSAEKVPHCRLVESAATLKAPTSVPPTLGRHPRHSVGTSEAGADHTRLWTNSANKIRSRGSELFCLDLRYAHGRY
ncbi:hypothetical protein BS47DRAFT_1364635 [Hydnum rufescens UP504]|uniref:Uncharacterized protein n=1 Tax=Hydnum rufescens UP504 TaxID=1448309 RepID=A0A9P6AQW2_9AGAM|nr:hypothetical protein BS47DRAFT_1364635 [Hydnum rufescens UP504]